MCSTFFNLAFYAWTAKSVILGNLVALIPARRPIEGYIRFWAKGVRLLMAKLAGIRVEFRGREHLPSAGPYLIASKHQSYCDGIMIASVVPDLAVVANKGLLKIPLLGRLLKRLEMIMVENCGGGHGQTNMLTENARAAAAAGRNILIYPEGQLMRAGERGRYRSGIYHLYKDLQIPVVPVATNMGLRWPQNERKKFAGSAVVEFMSPIAPGLSREEFMRLLEKRIETRTEKLIREAA